MPAKDVNSTDPMVHRKDDHVESEGPGDGYEQKITRTSADNRNEEITYFDRAGAEVPESGVQKTPPKQPGHAPDPKPGHAPEHKQGGSYDRH